MPPIARPPTEPTNVGSRTDHDTARGTTMEYKLVSADAHFIEPPNLWKDWLPAKWQQIAPKLVKDKDGGDGSPAP
jgi:hypothetical protein